MKSITKKTIALLVLVATSTAFAVNINSGAASNSGFALSDGTDLATGSLIRIGVFTISDSLVSANASSFSFLNANFIQIGTSYIGQGNPFNAVSETNSANNGLFNSSLSSINTTSEGLNIATAKLSYWVFNATTAVAATQQGVFSSTTWAIPAGDASGTDTAFLNTDINDLTTSNDGQNLAATARILIGGFGPGLNISGQGRDFTLASAIPEPATYAALFGLGVLGLAAFRRRRTAA